MGEAMVIADPRSWPVAARGALQLSEREVHLWCLDQKSISDIPDGMLDAAEEARAAEFRFDHLSRRFRIVHWMRRDVLSRYLGVSPKALRYCSEIHGRPKLDERFGNGRLRFNASQSDDFNVLAVTLDEDIGIDIEIPRPIPELLELARRNFHLDELRVIEALPDHAERIAAFYRVWTRKEAILKATGLGLNVSLNAFAVDVAAVHAPRITRADAGAFDLDWTLLDFSVQPSIYGALAMTHAPDQVSTWSWRP
jgi:4'-phosphopantetheinyl transferase